VASIERVSAATIDTRPTYSQLLAELVKSATATTLPTEAKQMLTTLTTKYSGYYVGLKRSITSGCNATEAQGAIPTNPGTVCLYGNPKGVKSLVLFGDSQSNMWTPALDALGTSFNMRIYAFSKSGCPPWGYTVTHPDGSAFPQCVSWRASVKKYINSTHPNYVMVTGAAGFTSMTHRVTSAEVTAGIQRLTTALKPSGSHFMLLSNIPWIVATNKIAEPNVCLSSNQTAINNCFAARTSDALVNVIGIGLTQASTTYKIPLVDISSLFCTATTCVSVVGKQLVYSDRYHALGAYITYISRAMIPILAPKLI
jgi:hypothetical protein